MGIVDKLRSLFGDDKTPTTDDINSGKYPNIAAIQKLFDQIGPDPALVSKHRQSQFAAGEHEESNTLFDLAKQFNEENPSLKNLLNPTDLSATQDSQQLMAALLQKNQGLAIGDIHTSKNLHEYVAGEMTFFKAHGVKALAVEAPEDDQKIFDEIAKLPPEEGVKKFDEFVAAKKPESAMELKYDKAMQKIDAPPQDLKGVLAIARAAVANGIMLIAQDGTRHQIDKELDSSLQGHNLRISEANFTWTKNIETFCKAHNFGANDKIISFGGEGHFTNNQNGYVDELTGFPSINIRPKSDTGKDFSTGGPNMDYTIQINDSNNELKNTLKSIDPNNTGQISPPQTPPNQSAVQQQVSSQATSR